MIFQTKDKVAKKLVFSFFFFQSFNLSQTLLSSSFPISHWGPLEYYPGNALKRLGITRLSFP